jgi:hypothetical protein
MEQFSKDFLRKLISLDKKMLELDKLAVKTRMEIYDLSWSIYEKSRNKKMGNIKIKKP